MRLRYVFRRANLGSAIAAITLLCSCGDDDGSDTSRGTPTPTVTSPGPTATATVAPCPSTVTFDLRGLESDLDYGFSGIVHDSTLSDGASLRFNLECPTTATGECGACQITGVRAAPDGSNRRCANATENVCVGDDDCPGSRCDLFLSAPLPLSAGGAPACVVDRIVGDVTGTFTPATGELDTDFRVEWLFHIAFALERPCPICSGAAAGNVGTCVGGNRDGKSCVVHATNPLLGNTSFDCPPEAELRLSGVPIDLDLTTGRRSLAPIHECLSDPASPACYCADQPQTNGCLNGQCRPSESGDFVCSQGPIDGVCERETFRPCFVDADCPAAGDRCGTRVRECSGATETTSGVPEPIVHTGIPHPTSAVLVGVFCIPASSSPIQNQALGLPGPGRLRIPASACVGESCTAR